MVAQGTGRCQRGKSREAAARVTSLTLSEPRDRHLSIGGVVLAAARLWRQNGIDARKQANDRVGPATPCGCRRLQPCKVFGR